jgi:heptosyltransferase III
VTLPTGPIVVIRPGALGDTLLTVDALRALAQRYPGHPIELVGHAQAGALLAKAGVVAFFTPFDSIEVTGLFRTPPVVPERWASASAAVLWLAEAATIADAFRAAGVANVVAASPPHPEAGVHAAEQLLGSLAPLGVPFDPPAAVLPLTLPSAVQEQVTGEQLVLVHPGSGSGGKNWPPDRFAELIRRLRAAGSTVALLAGPADADAIRSVRARRDLFTTAVVEPPTILDLAFAIGRAALYIGNDSGPTHVSARIGAPTVAIFGPTDPAVWAPQGPRVAVVTRSPWPERDEVWEAAQELLKPGSHPA